jgi:hypothetical protein
MTTEKRMSLANVSRSVAKPPRIVLYGVPGIGKTTFAAMADKPIFVPVEDGLGKIDVPSFPKPETYDEFLDALQTLCDEEHDYRTVVIDSIDRLEPMMWEYICQTTPTEKGAKVDSIEGYGFGKGYVIARAKWHNLLAGLDMLRDRGMAVILLAHSTVARVEPPDLDAYDRYQLRLHKHADAVVCDWADAILFANYNTVAVTSGERTRGKSDGSRVVYTTERAAWRAKNRYAMPDKIAIKGPEDWAIVHDLLNGRGA